MMARALLILCLTLWWTAPDAASAQPEETVETDLSSRNIAIESNFTGAEIVVFGTVLNGRQTSADHGLYDLAVVIRGPEKPIVVRRKSRVLGIWVNTQSRSYQNVPGYYAVLSSRPLNEIAEQNVLRKYGIGFSSLLPERTSPNAPADPFREAVIRIRERKGLYRRSDEGVSFIGSSLFRATVDLPTNVPVGEYRADVFLFADGELINHNSSQLTIHKEGFERFVFTLAFQQPLVYGIAAVIAAMIAGLLASAIFRRS